MIIKPTRHSFFFFLAYSSANTSIHILAITVRHLVIKIIGLFFCFFSLIPLSACQSTSQINIQIQGKQSLSFTGRGAAAGAMLDSLMPGGIAIGIAIDEGIAKDFYKSILDYQPDFSIQKLIHSHLKKSHSNFDHIEIKSYGFRTSSKGENQISAWLDLQFVCKQNVVDVAYPSDFSDIATEDFDRLKNNGKKLFEMLDEAVYRALQSSINNQCK